MIIICISTANELLNVVQNVLLKKTFSDTGQKKLASMPAGGGAPAAAAAAPEAAAPGKGKLS